MILRVFFSVLLSGLFFLSPPTSAETVDLQLVLAVDVSGSMDDDEHALQRDGYVSALSHPQVVQAIQGGYVGRIAVTYVEWAGTDSQVVAVPWRVISDQPTADTFAGELAKTPIAWIRGTSISGALAFAAGRFDGRGFESERRVIDISGDGPNNMGLPVDTVRDRVVARGIVINGLPVMIHPQRGGWGIGEDLEPYYRDCVIGGRGSFVVPVTEAKQFARAVRRKLVLEIAGLQPTSPQPRLIRASTGVRSVQHGTQYKDYNCGIGEAMRRRLFQE
jgi:hypothetical protein